MFTGSITHFTHSLVGQLKFLNMCSHCYRVSREQTRFWRSLETRPYSNSWSQNAWFWWMKPCRLTWWNEPSRLWWCKRLYFLTIFLVACYATLHPALSVRPSVHPFVGPTVSLFCFCDLWPHCSCPNDQVTSNTAPTHPHATGVSVYPALFVLWPRIFWGLVWNL